MPLSLQMEPVPLAYDSGGVIRVAGSRVALDQIVAAFQEGASAEEIAARFPVLGLGDVYDAIAYYLRHREEVDSYLREQEANRIENRREALRRAPAEGLRERLLARRLG